MEGEAGSRMTERGGTHCPFPFPFLVSRSRLPSLSLLRSSHRSSLSRFPVSLLLHKLFSPFVLFSLYFYAVVTDSVRMFKQFILSTLLLAFDVVALRCFAHQPEAVVFALLATLTLPFFIVSGLEIRGE